MNGILCEECDEDADVSLCNEHARSSASDRVRLWLTVELVKPSCDLTAETKAAIERMADDLEVD